MGLAHESGTQLQVRTGLELDRVQFDADDEGGIVHTSFDLLNDFEDNPRAIVQITTVLIRALVCGER